MHVEQSTSFSGSGAQLEDDKLSPNASKELNDELDTYLFTPKLTDKVSSELPSSMSKADKLNKSFDILISCENYLDVFENSLVQGFQVSEEELQRIYTESYQAGSKDKIHYPSENHDISGQVLQGAIKTMRVEKDPNTNKDVPIFYIDVSRVYKNVYGDVALAAMSLSIYMRKHGKEKTIQLLSLPRGERLATLWRDVEHDYIKAIPLMPITNSHYVDASASRDQRQFYHRYFSNGENIAGNQLRLRDDSDKTNLVTFRRPLNDDEYH